MPIKTGGIQDSEWQEGHSLLAQSPVEDQRSFALWWVKCPGAGEDNLLGLLDSGIQCIILCKPASEKLEDYKIIRIWWWKYRRFSGKSIARSRNLWTKFFMDISSPLAECSTGIYVMSKREFSLVKNKGKKDDMKICSLSCLSTWQHIE